MEAAFISHLDMMRLFERAFRRLNVRLKFTEGFNPHPKINFILPMSVGLCSNKEVFEVDIEEQIDEDLVRKLNFILPKGLKILKIEEAIDKIQVSNMYYKCILEAEEEFCIKFNQFMAENAVVKREKDGKEIYKNVKDYLLEFKCDPYTQNQYEIIFHIELKNGSFIRPEEIIKSCAQKYNLNYKILKIVREKTNFQRVI